MSQPVVHVLFVSYCNPARTLTRWRRDVRPAADLLTAKTGAVIEVTCVDNSPDPDAALAAEFGTGYLWQRGRNLMYGPAVNVGVKRVPSAAVLYACTNHGRMLDPLWAHDLIHPILTRPQVALTGWLVGSNSPRGVADHAGPDGEWVAERYRFVHPDGTGHVPEHVQGGVFAARTAFLLEHPYPETPAALTHLYTDHLITWEALTCGYLAWNVPTVRSVWKDVVRDTRGLRYVHDCSEEA